MDIVQKTEIVDGIETRSAAWCLDGLWTASVHQAGWRCSYQVDGSFSGAKTREEAVAAAIRLAVAREALRTPESDAQEREESRQRVKQLSQEVREMIEARK